MVRTSGRVDLPGELLPVLMGAAQRMAGAVVAARRQIVRGAQYPLQDKKSIVQVQVRVPEPVANLAWGGLDFRTLYLTATHSVYAIPVKAGPRHEPYMSGRASTGPGALS